MVKRSNIEVAGIASGTDKISQHGYHRFYAHFLADYEGEGSIVEIGYGKGKSISFWASLYPAAFLFVADKSVAFKGDGFEVVKLDQSSKEELIDFAGFLRDKDVGVVIDDGSHIPEHQLLSFNCLFGVLELGGVYIIEDIECSYWKRGTCYGYPTEYGVGSSGALIGKLLKLVHWLNRDFLSSSEVASLKSELVVAGFDLEVLQSIASISFGHNCVAIRKGLLGDEEYANRPYLHADRV